LSADVEVLGTFKKALCFKAKTFAFLDQASRMWWSGHPLVPRNAEGFGKRFVRECSELLLAGDLAGVHAVYVNFHQAITQRHLEVGDFLRMEVLRETFEKYREDVDAGRRKASPAYELARLARKGDRPPVPVAYYITSTDSSLPLLDRYKLAESWDRHFRDEDPSYYLQRLDDFAAKFEVFFDSKDFKAIFSPEGLFPIDPGALRIRSAETPPEDEDFLENDFGIWLDV